MHLPRRLAQRAMGALLLSVAMIGTAHAGCRIVGASGIVDGGTTRNPHGPQILVPFNNPVPPVLYTFKDASGFQRYHGAEFLNIAGAHLTPPVASEPLSSLDCHGLTELAGKRLYVVWEPPAGARPFAAPDGGHGGIRIDVAPGVAIGFWMSGNVHERPGGALQIGNQTLQAVSATGALIVPSLFTTRMHFVLLATGEPFQPGVVYPQLQSLGRFKYVAAPDDAPGTTSTHTNELIVRAGERSQLTEGVLAPFELATKLSTCNLTKATGGFIDPMTSVTLAAVSAAQLGAPGASSEVDGAQVDWQFRCDALLDRQPRVRFDAGIAAPGDVGVALPAADAVVGVQLLDSRGVPLALGTPSQGFPWAVESATRTGGLAACDGTPAQCVAGSANWMASPANAAGAGNGRMGDVFPLRFRYYRRSDTSAPVVPGPIQVRFTVTLDTP